MKEVLTKSFWQGVKKTYYEALKGPPPEDCPPQAPAEGKLHAVAGITFERAALNSAGTNCSVSNGRALGPETALGKHRQPIRAIPVDKSPLRQERFVDAKGCYQPQVQGA